MDAHKDMKRPRMPSVQVYRLVLECMCLNVCMFKMNGNVRTIAVTGVTILTMLITSCVEASEYLDNNNMPIRIKLWHQSESLYPSHVTGGSTVAHS